MKSTLLLVALVLGLGATAHAQTDDSDKSCGRAEKILAKGHPEQKEAWAYSVIIRCSGGGATLATLWNPPPADSAGLAQLASASADLADRRVLDAALLAFSTTTLSQPTRRAAMVVSLAQYAPDLSISTSTWSDPEHAILASRSDYFQRPGDVPLVPADRDRIRAAFAVAAQTDPDPQIRRVAIRLVHDLVP